ncbi:MAG: SDR family NAD(P)-dependent oxidoreductase [Clostridia bacterium]|nr:SDR family NAD(P)-dependent oxidoreductase [Clostridia bacterium]
MKIVITGAADGLGKEIANEFKDSDLILLDNDEEKLEEVAKKLRVKYFVCDLAKTSGIETVCEKILAENKTIDILINCAGVWLDETEEKDLEKYRNMILVNLFGPIAMTKALLPRFMEQKRGLIININSQAGIERERATGAVYGASKAGLVAYRQNVKKEFAKNGIRITDLCPGMIETGLFEKAGVEVSDDTFKKYSLSKSQVVKAIKFIIEQPSEVFIPSLELKNIHENLQK